MQKFSIFIGSSKIDFVFSCMALIYINTPSSLVKEVV
jgi:hypothetical protein